MPLGSASLSSRALAGEQFFAKTLIGALSIPALISGAIDVRQFLEATCTPLVTRLNYPTIVHPIGNHIIGEGIKLIFREYYRQNFTSATNLFECTGISQNTDSLELYALSNPNFFTGNLIESEKTQLIASVLLPHNPVDLLENNLFSTITATSLPFTATTTITIPTVFFHREYINTIGSHVIGHGVEQDSHLQLSSNSNFLYTKSLLFVYGRLTKVYNYRGRDSKNNFVFWQSYYTPDLNPVFTDPQFFGEIREKVLLGTDIIPC